VEAGLSEPGRILVSSAGDTPVRLVTDPDMLRQVIGNLLRNAVQYGGADPIEARVAVNGDRFVLEVASGGTPVGAVDRRRLFERFYRGHTGQRTDGFGLGLALVAEICEVLGGTVELTPEEPRTVFRVTLPTVSSKAPGSVTGVAR
jgi:signal transduction histidine kinase